MFVHSERVPRLYKIASNILKDVVENSASLKELIYTQKKVPNVKPLYALLSKTLQNFSEINRLITESKLLEKEKQFNPWLARILITQLLWSDKGLEGTCKPIEVILSYRARLEKHMLKNPKGSCVAKVSKPRYVRVNTLAVTFEEALDGFQQEGWQLIPFSGKTYNQFIEAIKNLENNQFMVDIQIDDLLVFPSRTEFYQHEAYKCRSIILQDKASCLPVQLLNPSPGATVLDVCAAPGMKTTFLAAKIKNQGTIYAVEQQTRRYDALKEFIQGTYETCIKTINKDAIQVTSEECPNVEYILVDPSCSGSGIVDRLEIDGEQEVNQVRLQKLSYFQVLLLTHALTNFPHTKRVVYSTCSIHPTENECVVEEVLRNTKNFKLVSANKLLRLPFNSPSEIDDDLYHIRSKCIQILPERDLSNGFFVAVFERKSNDENQNLNMTEKYMETDKSSLMNNEEITFKIKDAEHSGMDRSMSKKRKNKKNSDADMQSKTKLKRRESDETEGVGSKIEEEVNTEASNEIKSKSKKKKKAQLQVLKENKISDDGILDTNEIIREEEKLVASIDMKEDLELPNVFKKEKKKKHKKREVSNEEGNEKININTSDEIQTKKSSKKKKTVKLPASQLLYGVELQGIKKEKLSHHSHTQKKVEKSSTVSLEENSELLTVTKKMKKKHKKQAVEEENEVTRSSKRTSKYEAE
ncbi:hypothetical protein FQA39_LY14415 [Lamprigera yunnana]|nr:hypothetical protein FQA39_LY14415 [Lamprigera yunnana]